MLGKAAETVKRRIRKGASVMLRYKGRDHSSATAALIHSEEGRGFIPAVEAITR